VLVVGFAYWHFEDSFSLPFQQLASFGSSLESSVTGQIQENFSAPVPLHGPTRVSGNATSTLTSSGVIADTNQERQENGGLPTLAENATLDDIATVRLADMFQQQYFAHVGPQGESAVTVASTVGYSYIALGENLALGNFAGDQGVVTAWMNSPGHRANILDIHYTQIGVAVQAGMFQGTKEWIAVQVFGKPASACPSADPNLNAEITAAQNEISQMIAQLQSEKTAIDEMQPQSGQAYNQQVTAYNNLVAQYNTLVAETKTEIAQYNAQVSAFNACIAA
jgi:uncharacterized protein YkwD/uncharacterized protein YukE